MKKFSPKIYLLAITLGLAGMLFSHAAQFPIGIEAKLRNNMDFISNSFWQAWPADLEIGHALFGTGTDWITAYTQNRSGYTAGDCNPANMVVYYVNTGIWEANKLSDITTGNSIIVLNEWDYSHSPSRSTKISTWCVAIIWSGKVIFRNSIDVNYNNGFWYGMTKVIVDNVENPELQITKKTYTNSGDQSIGIIGNYQSGYNYTISWDIQNIVTGSSIDNQINTGAIKLTAGDGWKKIIIIIEGSWNNSFLNHIETGMFLITTPPDFSGITQNNIAVTSGAYYTTGVTFTFTGDSISWATINNSIYTGGTLISSNGVYVFKLTDKAGNSTGVTFTIDRTNPTFLGTTLSGVTVLSGGIYNTGIRFTFNDANLAGATLDGVPYTSGSLINTEWNHRFVVTDEAGNSTGTYFTIDTTLPVCTPISPLSGSTITSGALDFTWSCSDNSGLSGLTLILNDSGNNQLYSTNLATTWTSFIYTGWSNIYNWIVVATDIAGNNSTMAPQRITYIKPIIISLQAPGLLYQGKYYVTGNNVSVVFSGNLPFIYQFTGNLTNSSAYVYSPSANTTKVLNLSNVDGVKAITMNYWTGTQTGAVWPVLFYMDKTMPAMSGIYPTANFKTNQTTINFQRSWSDVGGISGYTLLLDGNIIYTGSAKNFSLDNISTGSHQWSVQGTDIAGNASATALINFIVDTTPPAINGVTNGIYYSWTVTPSFTDGTGMLNGQLFVSSTPITGDWNYSLVVTNDMGNTSTVNFVIDKASPIITPTSPLTGSLFTSSNTISFLRNGSDANISWYMFNLYGAAYSTWIALTTNTITLPNMPNNDYTRVVKAIDKAGNISTSTWQAFRVHITLTGSISISGIVNINWQAFSNSTFGIQVLWNKDAGLSIIGDLLSGTISDSLIAGVSKSIIVTPTTGDWIKTFNIQASSGVENFWKAITGYLDTTSPSTPSFSGQPTNYSGAFTLSWTAATDAGVGVWSYTYAILSGSTIVKSGVSSWASIGIDNMEIGWSGNYSVYVAAKDLLGNTSTSGTRTFGYAGIEDLTVDSFSITSMTNADLNVKYRSSIITVSGITTGSKVLASVDTGSLIVNGTDVGVNQYVKLGDQVQIALYSSQEYNDMTSGKLTIGDQYSIFKIVTTLGNGSSSSNNNYTISNLTTTEKLHVSMIYNTLANIYSGSAQTDFMISFKALVKTKITTLINNNQNITDIETMEYLYNLINTDYAGSSSNNTSASTYIAPNGKSYDIQYSSNGYTSSTFIVVRYFTSLTDIKSYIDQKNPKSVYIGGNYSIDQSRTTNTYIAPNGKSYVFFKTTDGKYGSNNFQTAKFFKSLADMKHHINVNNPAS